MVIHEFINFTKKVKGPYLTNLKIKVAIIQYSKAMLIVKVASTFIIAITRRVTIKFVKLAITAITAISIVIIKQVVFNLAFVTLDCSISASFFVGTF